MHYASRNKRKVQVLTVTTLLGSCSSFSWCTLPCFVHQYPFKTDKTQSNRDQTWLSTENSCVGFIFPALFWEDAPPKSLWRYFFPLRVPDFFSCKRIMRALSGMSTCTGDAGDDSMVFPRRDRRPCCIPFWGSDISHAVDGLGPAAEDGAELLERWKIVGWYSMDWLVEGKCWKPAWTNPVKYGFGWKER